MKAGSWVLSLNLLLVLACTGSVRVRDTEKELEYFFSASGADVPCGHMESRGDDFAATEFSGTVVDSSTWVLPSAVVIVGNADNPEIAREVTSKEGRFEFPSLGVGRYFYKVCLDGFLTVYGIVDIKKDAPLSGIEIMTYAD